jgi:DNA-directed RNA polymerase subunit L
MNFPYQNYSVIIEETNDSDSVITLTTKNFKVLNKETGEYISKDDVRKIFPPSSLTGDYIDLVRLRPKLSEGLEGESIKLSADLDIGTAGEDGAFNVVSACSYEMSVNNELVNYAWKEKEQQIRNENKGAADINEILEYAKKDFLLLDAKRMIVPDSFNFIVESVGVFENSEIIRKACQIIMERLQKVATSITQDTSVIEKHPGDFWMVKLENEDFTITKILEYILYSSHFEGDNLLDYCASSRIHPHIPVCYIKLHFREKEVDEEIISQLIYSAAESAIPVFKYISSTFATKE